MMRFFFIFEVPPVRLFNKNSGSRFNMAEQP
jgi:hypothetical protein